MLQNDGKKNEAARYVTALYRGILRREPDPAGQEHFINAILTGQSVRIRDIPAG